MELQQDIFELQKCKKIGRMLGKMMSEPESFCARFQDK